MIERGRHGFVMGKGLRFEVRERHIDVHVTIHTFVAENSHHEFIQRK